MKLFAKMYIGSNSINSSNTNLSSYKDYKYGLMGHNNNQAGEDDVNGEEVRVRQPDDEYSIAIMKKYPLGFTGTGKESEKDEDNRKSMKSLKTPRKKKKKAKERASKVNTTEDEEKKDEEKRSDEPLECVYNVWVPDCMRSKKDFMECQQINIQELQTKDLFEKVFQNNGFLTSIMDYDDFLDCGKQNSTRILQGVETRFGVEIDVSDSFYGPTGSKLRAYSFQGASRRAVYVAFSYFSSSWTPDIAINTVTNYDTLFQPENWYFSVIQQDVIKVRNVPKIQNEMKSNDVANASNSYQNLETTRPSPNHQVDEDNFNQNRRDTYSEVDPTDNINNETASRKNSTPSRNDHLFKLCVKYLKAPKIKLQKLLFTSIKTQTESISYTMSHMAKLVNENNNQHRDSNSPITVNESATSKSNSRTVNFLLDAYNQPIPIWLKPAATERSLAIY